MILDPSLECADQKKLLDDLIKPRLSSLFIRVYDNFAYYRWKFNEANVDPSMEPMDLLNKLPFMTKRDYMMLERDAFLQADRSLFYVETTSGSTGRPKRRFQSLNDELNELRLATRVFAGFDISKDDVVLFMDVGNPSIYIWFAKALENLGVRNTIYYGIQSDFNESLKGIARLDPTIICTIPSLLARSYETILRMYSETKGTSLRKIIYFGEKLSDGFRKRLQDELNVEIFSHYGGTEVSTIGGECTQHNGIHIYNDANYPSLVEPNIVNETTQEGEIAWTTTQIDIQPVIKYRIGDVVRIDYSPCPCGRTSPRINVIGRTNDGFSFFGEKFYYDTFLNTIYSDLDEMGFMQIILSTDQNRDKLSIILPDKLKSNEKKILDSLYHTNELEYFLNEDFIQIELKFVPNDYFVDRKIQSIVDRRVY
jgi:phenylacetate-CoA ligase